MEFKNIEEAKQIIEEAKKYIENATITVKDIFDCVVFHNKEWNQYVYPIPTYGVPAVFSKGGLDGIKKIDPYSDKPVSAEQFVSFLTKGNYTKTNKKLSIVEI